MGLLFGKVNIDDRDLKVIDAIVGRVCKSLDNLADAAKDIAKAVRDKEVMIK